MNKPIILGTFDLPVKVLLSSQQAEEALRLLNLHHLGDEQCNEYDASFTIVSKYPDRETEEFKQSHCNCRMVYETTVTASLLSDGRLSFS